MPKEIRRGGVRPPLPARIVVTNRLAVPAYLRGDKSRPRVLAAHRKGFVPVLTIGGRPVGTFWAVDDIPWDRVGGFDADHRIERGTPLINLRTLNLGVAIRSPGESYYVAVQTYQGRPRGTLHTAYWLAANTAILSVADE